MPILRCTGCDTPTWFSAVPNEHDFSIVHEIFADSNPLPHSMLAIYEGPQCGSHFMVLAFCSKNCMHSPKVCEVVNEAIRSPNLTFQYFDKKDIKHMFDKHVEDPYGSSLDFDIEVNPLEMFQVLDILGLTITQKTPGYEEDLADIMRQSSLSPQAQTSAGFFAYFGL